MTPFPPFWAGFHCWGLGCYFVYRGVVTVGYCPTGSSKARENPFQGTNLSTKHSSIASVAKPTQQSNPTP